MNAPADLSIRRLTLYKHGVGVVERAGTVNGELVSLVFRADEVNDVLKSLLVIDRQGDGALGIGYDTPLGNRPSSTIPELSDEHSLLDLLSALRGRRVRLVVGDATEAQEHSGRLVGIDGSGVDEPLRSAVVALLDDQANAVVAVPLRRVRQVVLLEERSADDLRYTLDALQDRAAQRTVTIRLSPGEHDLVVSYLVPSPTWRVTYRLVAMAETDTNGTLRLQGWGLFDNRFEDLHDVQVSLVAGQPISFIYDLVTSRIPARRTVQDEARIAAGPVEYEALAAQAPAAGAALAERGRGSVQLEARAASMARDQIEAPAPLHVAASGSEAGELFQYDVTTPVTVSHGESALIPIMDVELPYRRELLFNRTKLPDHPTAAARFTNNSGLVLERGPITVFEDGAYRGEAIVPFTRIGTEVYLAFAVELGITVKIDEEQKSEMAGIRIAGAVLEEKYALTRRATYHLRSTLDTERRVTIEHQLWSGAVLVDTVAPDTQSVDTYRWTVVCPPRGLVSLTVAERRHTWQSSTLLDQSYATLQEFLRKNWLDRPTLDRLAALLRERDAIADNEREMERLRGEREEIYSREEQLRRNMAALAVSGDEGALRRQVVAQLQSCEARAGAIAERLEHLKGEIVAHQAAIDAQLATLRVDDATAQY